MSPTTTSLLYLTLILTTSLLLNTTEAAITCGQVLNNLSPCITYVQYGGPVPSQCCDGVRGLYNSANNASDRQTVCKCLKQAVNGIPYSGFNLGLAAGLPGKCGVNIPYKISPSTNCDQVQ